jgi:hypothetical protein
VERLRGRRIGHRAAVVRVHVACTDVLLVDELLVRNRRPAITSPEVG